jgi:hypothetical protein
MPMRRVRDIFDVLVDRPAHAQSIFNYPSSSPRRRPSWAGMLPTITDYVRRGGTLVVKRRPTARSAGGGGGLTGPFS